MPAPDQTNPRRLPIGAEVVEGGVHFRIWAGKRTRARVVIDSGDGAEYEMKPEGAGYFSTLVRNIGAGALYRFKLDDDPQPRPDPASRYQPMGPHVSSEVIDPSVFPWTDAGWRGIPEDQHVLYEMHIGTFTPEGTWQAARAHLPALRDLGVTTLQIMPVADFGGKYGWGYDGVDKFAPTRLYGRPDDFRAFVDDAHGHGLAVILDVVYNHAGPDGNYLKNFSPRYFSKRIETDWGEAINFSSEPVREFCVSNARYWIDEFHLDGLRLDATQDIHDDAETHVLRDIARAARDAAPARHVYIVAENEPQNSRLVRPAADGGYGINAMFNDDFHHAARVALTGLREAYFTDYRGTPQEFVSAVKHGFLFQGQWYEWQEQPRGTPSLDIPLIRFSHFLENHDQIANRGFGARLHTLAAPGQYRAFVALLLLAPQTPLLFQGQEFASSSPFSFFADHDGELAGQVAVGRAEFLEQFPSLATKEAQDALPPPCKPETFLRAKLNHDERKANAAMWDLHRDLLRIRRTDPVFRAPPGGVDGAVLAPQAFMLRWFGRDGDDRLMIVNLGSRSDFTPAPEPLLAPPAGRRWALLWSSEDPRYDGHGTALPAIDGTWNLAGQSAIVMKAEAEHEA
jgi:maltooligosyltrehalose trehalohydrolase